MCPTAFNWLFTAWLLLPWLAPRLLTAADEVLAPAEQYAVGPDVLATLLGRSVTVYCVDGVQVHGNILQISSLPSNPIASRQLRIFDFNAKEERVLQLTEVLAVCPDGFLNYFSVPFESDPLLQDESAYMSALHRQLGASDDRIWPSALRGTTDKDMERLEALLAEVNKHLSVAFKRVDTPHFILFTDTDRSFLHKLAKILEAAEQEMYEFYRVSYSTNVWQGKAVVFVFGKASTQGEFVRRYFDARSREDQIGACYFGDGDVFITCKRGMDSEYCSYAVVHEMVHGFNYRYLTSVGLPSWLDEGIADFIAQRLFPGGGEMRMRIADSERLALQGEVFDLIGASDRALVDWEYGVAFKIVQSLAESNIDRLRLFVRLLKEGFEATDAAESALGMSLEELGKKGYSRRSNPR